MDGKKCNASPEGDGCTRIIVCYCIVLFCILYSFFSVVVGIILIKKGSCRIVLFVYLQK